MQLCHQILPIKGMHHKVEEQNQYTYVAPYPPHLTNQCLKDRALFEGKRMVHNSELQKR